MPGRKSVGPVSYSESGGLGLEAGEVGGQDTGLVELTRAHQAGDCMSAGGDGHDRSFMPRKAETQGRSEGSQMYLEST